MSGLAEVLSNYFRNKSLRGLGEACINFRVLGMGCVLGDLLNAFKRILPHHALGIESSRGNKDENGEIYIRMRCLP